jgi:medium-chain acyl-[acyl-carrier-protein] hydrolase
MADTAKMRPWIQYFQPRSHARLRLFCFAHAGGSASIFRTWSHHLPPAIEVAPVELPGHGNRLNEPLFTRLEPLVEDLAQELSAYLTTMPFAFFGHSMGGLISFELARQLRRQHAPEPLYLLISAHRAAHLPDPDPPIYDLPEPEFLEKLRELNGTPREVLEHAELMQMLMPILRADFAICNTYTYRPEQPLDYPISAFGGLYDQEVTRSELQSWQDLTCNTFALQMFAGDHFFVNSAQTQLLQVVSHILGGLDPER